MADNNALAKKWLNILKEFAPAEFMDSAASMTEKELNKKVLDCEKIISYTANDMDNDAELGGAKEHVKELAAPYQETIKVNTAMIRYMIYVLQNRGSSPAKIEVKKDEVLEDNSEEESTD